PFDLSRLVTALDAENCACGYQNHNRIARRTRARTPASKRPVIGSTTSHTSRRIFMTETSDSHDPGPMQTLGSDTYHIRQKRCTFRYAEIDCKADLIYATH